MPFFQQTIRNATRNQIVRNCMFVFSNTVPVSTENL